MQFSHFHEFPTRALKSSILCAGARLPSTLHCLSRVLPLRVSAGTCHPATCRSRAPPPTHPRAQGALWAPWGPRALGAPWGPRGRSGPLGAKGPLGPLGDQGALRAPWGPRGPSGPLGTKGPFGPIGNQGAPSAPLGGPMPQATIKN